MVALHCCCSDAAFTCAWLSRDFVEIVSGKVVYKGNLIPADGDFGTYAVADFSKVTQEGRYYLRADTVRSYPFSISNTVYQPEMNNVIFFAVSLEKEEPYKNIWNSCEAFIGLCDIVSLFPSAYQRARMENDDQGLPTGRYRNTGRRWWLTRCG